MKKLLVVTSLLFGSALLLAQSPGGGLDPADIIKPLANQWTTYSGDLSGKRYSALKLVNTTTVKNLSLKWVSKPATGCGPDGSGGSMPVSVGGLGTGEVNSCGPARFGGGILFVDGVLYGASNNDVYAIDARDGTVLWHYYWKYR